MNKTKRFFTLILAIIPILFLSLLFSGTETKAAGGSAVSVSYRTHVQTYGWQDWKVNGATAGTSGKAKRLESLQVKLSVLPCPGGIEYRTHVQTYGWQDWKANGDLAGTTGKAKRLEAIQIRLTGEMANRYDVYYRVHAETYGWLAWVKNGEVSGTEGRAKRLEALQIMILPKKDMGKAELNQLAENVGAAKTSDNIAFVSRTTITPAKTTFTSTVTNTNQNNQNNQNTQNNQPVVKTATGEVAISSVTHMQTLGWGTWSRNGDVSGCPGQGRRLEAFRIRLDGVSGDDSIEYQTHAQSFGWMDWIKNGDIAGTIGKAKRLEAIRVRLTGDIAKRYDVYYRVCIQGNGWQRWVKNGDIAGTTGKALQIEALQVTLLPAGSSEPPAIYKGFGPNIPGAKPDNQPANKPTTKPENKPANKPENKPSNKPETKPAEKKRDNSRTLDRILGGTKTVADYLNASGDGYLGIPYEDQYTDEYYDAHGYHDTLQCTSFFDAVMYGIGADPEIAEKLVGKNKYYCSTWIKFAKEKSATGELEVYSFPTVLAMVQSGKAEKGDLVLFESTAGIGGCDEYGNYNDNHMGFFWGNTSNEDLFWHSACSVNGIVRRVYKGNSSGNMISTIAPVSVDVKVWLVKMSH